jgi:hypothetical protein
MHHFFLCVLQRAVQGFPLGRWRHQGPDGSPFGVVLHTFRSFTPEERVTVVQKVYKNSNVGVGNGRADGPFPL